MVSVLSGVFMALRVGAIHLRIIFRLVVLVALAGAPALASSVSGDVSGAWTADQSPIVVAGDCRVPAGGALQIHPGVRVLLAPGASFVVEGLLQATGSEMAPVVITSAAPLLGPWRSIVIAPLGDARLQRCKILGGGDASATEMTGAMRIEGGSVTLNACEVSGSASNGIYIRSGALLVNRTRFNSNGGARPTDAALHVVSGLVTLGKGDDGNSIENSPFGVYNENLLPVDAGGAWWGSATGPQHASNLPGHGVSISDDVLFGGFMMQSPIPILGDVNRDGERDIADVAALARIIGGIDESFEGHLAVADIVQDGQLDLLDTAALLHIVLTEGP